MRGVVSESWLLICRHVPCNWLLPEILDVQGHPRQEQVANALPPHLLPEKRCERALPADGMCFCDCAVLMYSQRSCASTVGAASVQMLHVCTTCCIFATSCTSAPVPVGCIQLHPCLSRLLRWVQSIERGACCTGTVAGPAYCKVHTLHVLLVVLSPTATKMQRAALRLSAPRPTAGVGAACCWTAPSAWSCLQYLIHGVWVCHLLHLTPASSLSSAHLSC